MRAIRLLHVLALAGLILPARAASLSTQEEVAAHKLYVNKCAKCHKFYNPAKYSDAQWQTWMGKMSKKSKLSPAQEKLLSEYLNEKYRTPARAEAPDGLTRTGKTSP